MSKQEPWPKKSEIKTYVKKKMDEALSTERPF